MNAQDKIVIREAKEFLKNRIVKQAAIEGVALSSAEAATLTYSELTATPKQSALADEVGAGEPSGPYEQKISALIRNAYAVDKAAGQRQEWEKHLKALRTEDLYVLVMVQSAGVPLPQGYFGVFSRPGFFKSFLEPTFLCLATWTLAGMAALFTPLGSFIRSDRIRALLFVVWVLGAWGLGEWTKRRPFRP
jgi:hypothetical protein